MMNNIDDKENVTYEKFIFTFFIPGIPGLLG